MSRVANTEAAVDACEILHRSIVVRLRYVESEKGAQICAWGNGLPRRAWYQVGRLNAEISVIRDWVADFFKVWQVNVIDWTDYQEKDSGPIYNRAFTKHVDLRGVIDPKILAQRWQAVAAAGYELFWLLFHYRADGGLKQLGRTLATLLWQEQQVITFISDDIIIPWSMLYVPRPGTETGLDNELTVDMAAFLGYRHIVEHTFDVPVGEADIRHDGPMATAYYDKALDQPQPCIVAPTITALERSTSLKLATSKREAEALLRGAGSDDHLIYICCHCTAAATVVPELHLTDHEPITASTIARWLDDDGLRGNPLALINVCHGADFGAHPPSAFGRVLLDSGASSLLGPCLTIPAVFAGSFAEMFLTRVLDPRQQRFGETIRSLVQWYADEYKNPLGLSYSLFHGIDGHFCIASGSYEIVFAEGQ